MKPFGKSSNVSKGKYDLYLENVLLTHAFIYMETIGSQSRPVLSRPRLGHPSDLDASFFFFQNQTGKQSRRERERERKRERERERKRAGIRVGCAGLASSVAGETTASDG